MKTLVSNVSTNYKKQGKKPRIFCVVKNASDEYIISPGSLDSGDFTDTISDWGTISQSVDKYGGMSEKTGVDLKNILLGQRLTLCTEADLSPRQDGIISGAGKVMKQGVYLLSYDLVRNVSTGDLATVGMVIGRQKATFEGLYYYRVQRGYLQVMLPAGITTCEEAVIEFDGQADYSDTDFDLQVFAGTWTSVTSSGGGIFNDFDGWQSLGAYTGTVLNETWNTSEYSATTKNKIRLNSTARDLIVTNTGAMLKLMILSKNDADNSAAPTGNEFVQFENSTVKLKLRYNTQTLDNQVAEIYLGYDPLPATFPASLIGLQRIFTGVVDDFVIDDERITLKLKNNDYKKEVTIPKKIITQEAFANCPDSNIGKPFPLLYGDFDTFTGLHKNGIGYINTIYNPAGSTSHYNHSALSYPQDAYKGIVVSDDGTTKTLLYCGHAKQWGASGGLNQDNFRFIFVWNSTLKAYCIVPVSSATTTYTADDGYQQILSTPALSTNLADVLCEGKFKSANAIIPTKTVNSNAVNPEYAIDEIATNYATLANNNSYIDFIFSNHSIGSGTSANCFIVKAAFNGGMSATDLKIHLLKNEKVNIEYPDNFVDTGASTVGWVADGQVHFTFIDNSGTPPDRQPIDLEQYAIRIKKETATGSAYIYNFCAMVADDASSLTEFYSHGFGKPDDASGTITGTAYGLIENPSHVIESIARDEMSLATAEIDTTALDTMATELTAWKIAFQVLDRLKARDDLLHNLAKQSRSKLIWDEYNRLTGKAFDSTGYFSVSGTDKPADMDIFDTNGGTPANGSFTRNPICGNLTLSRVSIDEVYNDFVLKYRKNYATGEYQEVLTMTNGLGVIADSDTNMTEAYLENSQTLTALKQLCVDSYNQFKTTNTLEFQVSYIRDAATANKLLQYLIERMTARRYIANFTTRTTAIAHELGDFINIRDSRINDLFGETTAELKKWEIIRYNFNLDTQEIEIEAIEV